MAKRCNRCEQLKAVEYFSVSRSHKGGYSTICKACVCERNKEYWRTPDGRMSQIFANQTMSSKQRKHSPPVYTRAELTAWAYQNGLTTLWETWRNGNYEKSLIPSVDRKDPNKGYSLQNIRLVTWTENNDKAYEDRKACIHVTKQNRKIRQLTLEGILVAEFDSISSAARITGVGRVPINSVCRKKPNNLTAGGFKWEYAQQH